MTDETRQRPLHGRRRRGSRSTSTPPTSASRRSTSAAPAFADVKRGNLRLLLSGPDELRRAADARRRGSPAPGGWNRIHFIVDDLAAEVARLRTPASTFRNDIVIGPGGKQILLQDPSGNPSSSSSRPRAERPARPIRRWRASTRRAGAPSLAHRRRAVGTDRLHRIRRPARPHRAAARAVRRHATAGSTPASSRTRSPRATCCQGRHRPSSRSSAPGGSRGRAGAIVGGVAFIVPGLVLILALAALFLAASPPEWVLGAGAGAGAAVAAVARARRRRPGPGRAGDAREPARAAVGRSTRSPAPSLRPRSGPGWCSCCSPAASSRSPSRTRPAPASRRTVWPARSPRPVAATGGVLALAWVAFKVGALVLRRRLRDHPADAARRRRPLPLDDRRASSSTPSRSARSRPARSCTRSPSSATPPPGSAAACSPPPSRSPPRSRSCSSAPTASTACAPTAACARFLDGAGPAAIGAIIGVAIPLALALSHLAIRHTGRHRTPTPAATPQRRPNPAVRRRSRNRHRPNRRTTPTMTIPQPRSVTSRTINNNCSRTAVIAVEMDLKVCVIPRGSRSPSVLHGRTA